MPETEQNAVYLAPPPPIQLTDENWPQLSMSVGPFDAQILAAGTKGAAASASSKAARAAAAFAANDLEEEVHETGGQLSIT